MDIMVNPRKLEDDVALGPRDIIGVRPHCCNNLLNSFHLDSLMPLGKFSTLVLN